MLERTGITSKGSITALYTVLVDGDDLNEPVSDTVRGTLDGHIILSRKIAAQYHFPAIDLLNSVSRCMIDIVTDDHMKAAQNLRSAFAIYKDAEDMINVGAYVEGKNHRIDYAISKYDNITDYLKQGVAEENMYDEGVGKLLEMVLTLLWILFLKPLQFCFVFVSRPDRRHTLNSVTDQSRMPSSA